MTRFWRRRSGDDDALVCREFVELVTDYLEGRLSDVDRARFDAHLGECDGCRGYLEDIRRIAAKLVTGMMPGRIGALIPAASALSRKRK